MQGGRLWLGGGVCVPAGERVAGGLTCAAYNGFSWVNIYIGVSVMFAADTVACNNCVIMAYSRWAAVKRQIVTKEPVSNFHF